MGQAQRAETAETAETAGFLFREERITGDGHAIVQVLQDDEFESNGERFDSVIVDLNANGVCLTSDEPIAGAKVLCLIKVRHVKQRFFLCGEVRWASLDESGDIQLGVEFVENEISHLEEWRSLFE